MILQHKGSNIFYTDQGKGKTVVLLHGFLENSKMWDAFLPQLTKSNRIICIDLLGHGKTECLGYVHSMELMAEAVATVLNHLNIKKSIFIGHSMGGYVALAFAERNPDSVTKLCLMNSTAEEDSAERKQNRDRAINAVKQNHNIFIRLAVNNLFSAKNRTRLSKEIKLVIEEATKTPLQGIIAALEGMKIRPNRTHVLKTSSLNTTMIISKKDPVLKYSTLINEATKVNAKIVEFPDGHMSHIENKDFFLQSIMYFVEN